MCYLQRVQIPTSSLTFGAGYLFLKEPLQYCISCLQILPPAGYCGISEIAALKDNTAVTGGQNSHSQTGK